MPLRMKHQARASQKPSKATPCHLWRGQGGPRKFLGESRFDAGDHPKSKRPDRSGLCTFSRDDSPNGRHGLRWRAGLRRERRRWWRRRK